MKKIASVFITFEGIASFEGELEVNTNNRLRMIMR